MKDDLACEECRHLVRPGLSHWTVGYMLTLEGAKKLLNTDILQQVIPVDEYIPLMYNQQPMFKQWDDCLLRKHSSEILLNAFAARFALVKPRYDWLDLEYESDTSESLYVIDEPMQDDEPVPEDYELLVYENN